MGFVHDIAPYPGKTHARHRAQLSPRARTGVGFTLEGFSDPLGALQNFDANWAQIKGTDKAGKNSAPAANSPTVSLRSSPNATSTMAWGFFVFQDADETSIHGSGDVVASVEVGALVTLTRLGYSPRLVSEDEIEAGILEKEELKGLVVLQQTFVMPEAVNERRSRPLPRQAASLRSTNRQPFPLRGQKTMDYEFPRKDSGRPFAWATPNIVQGRLSYSPRRRSLPRLCPCRR